MEKLLHQQLLMLQQIAKHHGKVNGEGIVPLSYSFEVRSRLLEERAKVKKDCPIKAEVFKVTLKLSQERFHECEVKIQSLKRKITGYFSTTYGRRSKASGTTLQEFKSILYQIIFDSTWSKN